MKRIVAGVLLVAGSVSAQTGTLDQSSPHEPGWASYNMQYLWQVQIRPGLSGQLEGIRLMFDEGPKGEEFPLRVRLEAAPASIEPVFDGVVAKTVTGEEVIFVDMTAAGIMVTAGEPFVMEFQQAPTIWTIMIGGSHVIPPGAPLYPEPLYLNGEPFAPGYRIGFDTYVIEPPPCYCDCDGDTQLTLSDFGCFQTLFAFGDPYGDCNGDKVLNLADFGCFQTKFALGCP